MCLIYEGGHTLVATFLNRASLSRPSGGRLLGRFTLTLESGALFPNSLFGFQHRYFCAEAGPWVSGTFDASRLFMNGDAEGSRKALLRKNLVAFAPRMSQSRGLPLSRPSTPSRPP